MYFIPSSQTSHYGFIILHVVKNKVESYLSFVTCPRLHLLFNMLLHFAKEDKEGSKESGKNVHTSDKRNVL